jgi:extracellular factor (EF) 3-hydroxypalmitic acid methyl ester biosynthesis protein
MVNMIMRNPFEGSSLFGKVVNLWFLQQPPAEAHRNRIGWLADRITEVASRGAGNARHARILSLGCGPATEVQQFIQRSPAVERAHFTLLDFNEETLLHAQSAIQESLRQAPRKPTVEFGKRSVNQILKEAGKSIERNAATQFDFVYCAGLFDYLSDAVCQRLVGILYDWVAPGGLLVTTNVDRSNPRRITMDFLMEWHLNYRSGAELARLKPAGPVANSAVHSDATGVNIFFEARKPSGG